MVFVLLWVALPVGAGYLATNALNAGGFSGTDTEVDVSANPPPLLLTGHADTVRVRSTQVGMGDLHAARIDVTLKDVQFLSRQVGSVDGTLEGVRVAAANGDEVNVGLVTIKGDSKAAQANLTMSKDEAERLAASQLESQTGAKATISLASPDKVTIKIGANSQNGRLVIQDGALLLVPDGDALPAVTLVSPGDDNPFELTSVAIGENDVTLTGTIDLQALLG
jgi:hypothetical protein